MNQNQEGPNRKSDQDGAEQTGSTTDGPVKITAPTLSSSTATLTTELTRSLLRRVQRTVERARVWQPSLGASSYIGPMAVERFSRTVAQRFQAIRPARVQRQAPPPTSNWAEDVELTLPVGTASGSRSRTPETIKQPGFFTVGQRIEPMRTTSSPTSARPTPRPASPSRTPSRTTRKEVSPRSRLYAQIEEVSSDAHMPIKDKEGQGERETERAKPPAMAQRKVATEAEETTEAAPVEIVKERKKTPTDVGPIPPDRPTQETQQTTSPIKPEARTKDEPLTAQREASAEPIEAAPEPEAPAAEEEALPLVQPDVEAIPPGRPAQHPQPDVKEIPHGRPIQKPQEAQQPAPPKPPMVQREIAAEPVEAAPEPEEPDIEEETLDLVQPDVGAIPRGSTTQEPQEAQQPTPQSKPQPLSKIEPPTVQREAAAEPVEAAPEPETPDIEEETLDLVQPDVGAIPRGRPTQQPQEAQQPAPHSQPPPTVQQEAKAEPVEAAPEPEEPDIEEETLDLVQPDVGAIPRGRTTQQPQETQQPTPHPQPPPTVQQEAKAEPVEEAPEPETPVAEEELPLVQPDLEAIPRGHPTQQTQETQHPALQPQPEPRRTVESPTIQRAATPETEGKVPQATRPIEVTEEQKAPREEEEALPLVQMDSVRDVETITPDHPAKTPPVQMRADPISRAIEPVAQVSEETLTQESTRTPPLTTLISKTPSLIESEAIRVQSDLPSREVARERGHFEHLGVLNRDWPYIRHRYKSQESEPTLYARRSKGLISLGPSSTTLGIAPTQSRIQRTAIMPEPQAAESLKQRLTGRRTLKPTCFSSESGREKGFPESRHEDLLVLSIPPRTASRDVSSPPSQTEAVKADHLSSAQRQETNLPLAQPQKARTETVQRQSTQPSISPTQEVTAPRETIVQRAETEEAEEVEETEVDLEQLARDVYPIIRRMLVIERERMG